ncbi:unnamed protein product [Rhizoctonia solani]|uniref:Uncharacterized protein n=1 Tax=Rhizoctonia solani TaxID=456999 RepID=A0A8H3H6X3_9AGAM|nr:unnamed protein product [Rhizoctonia solani]
MTESTDPRHTMAQNRRATISVFPSPSRPYSSRPTEEKSAEPSPGPTIEQQIKHPARARSRRFTLSGSSFMPAIVKDAAKKLRSIPVLSVIQNLGRRAQPKSSKEVRIVAPDSPPPSIKTCGFESNQKTESEQLSNSPARSNVSGSNQISCESVQTSQTEEKIYPQQLQHTPGSEHARIFPPKSALKHRALPGTVTDEEASIREAHIALDSILFELVACVKEFRSPSQLDFSASIEDALILRNNEANKPFIDQLRRFDGFRARLGEIKTHDDMQLEDKHRAIGMAIGRAIQRMKEHQLKLRDEQLARSVSNGP